MGFKSIHTPGPWTIGKAYGAVVAPTGENMNIGGSDDVQHYGGYLVGESISNCNKPIITQAPALAESVIELLGFARLIDEEHGLHPCERGMITRAEKALSLSGISWDDQEEPSAGNELVNDLAKAIIEGSKERARHHWFISMKRHAENTGEVKPRYDTWQEAVDNWLDETTPAEQTALLAAGFIKHLKP